MDGEERLARFRHWMQDNGIQLQGCTIKQCAHYGGFGVFSCDESARDVLMVSPLKLALVPTNILKDPVLGTQYREMLENDVDERLLVMIFLMVERARGKSSSWSPYLDMLPSDFGTPLWYTDEELKELEGTALFEATKAQVRSLRKLYDNVKKFTGMAMSVIELNSETNFQDFLWANCLFWTRALNIPCPASFIRQPTETEKSNSDAKEEQTIWMEGLVPGIDFCNHAHRSGALWEVDGQEGSVSGIPHSMYLVAGPDVVFPPNSEIRINYGDKGNEELLFLYGFVEEDNPNDYIMVHFPLESLEQSPCFEYKLQLLQEQDLPLRWLLPASYLHGGFMGAQSKKQQPAEKRRNMGYSWSGLRMPPRYLDLLVFPEEMMFSLRVLAMSEAALETVASLLEELSHVPTKDDILAAVWEVCGDMQALSLLVDILSSKMQDLVDGTGTEDRDTELLVNSDELSRNRRASIIYRKGQKRLFKRFLDEARLALEACIAEDHDTNNSSPN